MKSDWGISHQDTGSFPDDEAMQEQQDDTDQWLDGWRAELYAGCCLYCGTWARPCDCPPPEQPGDGSDGDKTTIDPNIPF